MLFTLPVLAQEIEPVQVKTERVEYKGRKAIRLTKEAEGAGLGFLRGVEFQDGTIEADLAVKTTTPIGVRNPGFIGIAFRARADASHYEMFYLRPGNARAEDQAMHNHVLQYISSPDFDWYRLRREWPWVYEATVDLDPEGWTHIKIEVAGRTARLYVNHSANPLLIVEGLLGEDPKGGVGLWGSPEQESYFSNVRVTPGKPVALRYGGEAAGVWQLKYGSDAGQFECRLNLQREGNHITGTISGLLGPDVPVTGTWRNGYLELAFRGMWERRDAGDAPARLFGWIDGNSAKGRMTVVARADGVWSATREEMRR